MCCATRWPWTRLNRAASISERPAGKFTCPLTAAIRGIPLSAIFRLFCRLRSRLCHDGKNRACRLRILDFMKIRVVLPYHLQNLARVDGEAQLEVEGPVTLRSVLDALEARYPVLRGTIRDHGT